MSTWPQPFNPGRCRHQVTHRIKPAIVIGTHGPADPTESDWDSADSYGTLWVDIRSLQGRELEAAQSRWALATHKVEMHYINGKNINREDRLYWGTRVLNILDVGDRDGNQAKLTLTCQELPR